MLAWLNRREAPATDRHHAGGDGTMCDVTRMRPTLAYEQKPTQVPIAGVTSAPSDRPFKTIEHGRERAATRAAIRMGDEFPAAKQYGNPWKGEKDGKLYVPGDERLLRK